MRSREIKESLFSLLKMLGYFLTLGSLVDLPGIQANYFIKGGGDFLALRTVQGQSLGHSSVSSCWVLVTWGLAFTGGSAVSLQFAILKMVRGGSLPDHIAFLSCYFLLQIFIRSLVSNENFGVQNSDEGPTYP